ncbi:MAG: PrsW family intramembrane metalloprotease [SAR324 cluster bacterium]|nr:PrsW family intramembrane metalloprotease [SAR324 cluster bacterium]
MVTFLVLGGIPVLYWIWLFYVANRYKRSSVKFLIILFLAGSLCGLFALTLNHIIEKYTMFWSNSNETITLFGLVSDFPFYRLGFWFMVGFNEEFAKLMVLLLIAYPSRDFQEKFDGILYAAVVALGFATLENAYYVEQYGFSVLVIRTVVTLPTHIFMSVPMGYFLAQSLFSLKAHAVPGRVHFDSVKLILMGWGIAALLHASYDMLLSLDLKWLAYSQVLMMGGVTVFLWQLCLRQSHYAPSTDAARLLVRQKIG